MGRARGTTIFFVGAAAVSKLTCLLRCLMGRSLTASTFGDEGRSLWTVIAHEKVHKPKSLVECRQLGNPGCLLSREGVYNF